MNRYAVLYVPNFRLQALLRHYPHLVGEPVALVDSRGKKPQITEVNVTARARQVEIGMTPTQAMARCPNLHSLSANLGHERTAQNILLQSGELLSPFLETTGFGVITVDLPKERTLTTEELIQTCVTPLLSIGLEIRIGIAATPDLALLCARFADPVRLVDEHGPFLAPLPVEALEPTAELLSVFHSWGIRTIGQLVSLPMTDVCQRLGTDALSLWERASGGKKRPLKLITPQEFYSEQTELENPVEMLEPLLFLLRRFLEQITTRLAHAYLAVGKLRLLLRFEYNSPYQIVFTIPQPTRDVELLFRMLHTHLESFTSESAIIGLELAAKPVRPSTEQFSLLETGVRDPHQLAETLARLQALLGADRVGTPEIEASVHPDAVHLRPYDANAPTLAPVETLLIGLPLLRFRPPIPVEIVLNDLQPAFLYSNRFTGLIKRTGGPWLLRGDWWKKGQWTREEWDAETDEGVYRLVHDHEGWFLDGIYG